MTFKDINGNAPDYISSMFKPVGEVHSRTTRQTCKNDMMMMMMMITVLPYTCT